jgi:hypothetical protein
VAKSHRLRIQSVNHVFPLTLTIEFLLEEALSGAAKRPQNDQPGDKGGPGNS